MSLGLLLSCMVLVGIIGTALTAELAGSSRKQRYSFRERSRAGTALVSASLEAASAVRAGWDLFPGVAADPCPCHFALCCCKALSQPPQPCPLLALSWLAVQLLAVPARLGLPQLNLKAS